MSTELLRLVALVEAGFHLKVSASSTDHRELWSGLSRCGVPPTSLQLLVLQTLKEGCFQELGSESPQKDDITGPGEQQTNKRRARANARTA